MYGISNSSSFEKSNEYIKWVEIPEDFDDVLNFIQVGWNVRRIIGSFCVQVFRSSDYAYTGKKEGRFSAVPLVFGCIPSVSRCGNVPNELLS